MFSHRLPGDFTVNSLSRRLAELVAGGVPVLDLTATNPTRTGLPTLSAERLKTLSDGANRQYLPDPRGSLAAREEIAAYYAARRCPVPADRIVLTASTSESYSHLFRILADPGDEFLVPAPSYPLFEPLASLESVAVVPYPLRYDGRWWLDHAALSGAFSARTRGVIAVNPNNPTGSFLSGSESDALEELAADRGVPLILDEVFGDFVPPGVDRRPSFATTERALTFVLSGLSKVSGLPQLKLGWIVVAGPEATAGQALARLEWVADAFLSVGSPVQNALPALLGFRNEFQPAAMARITGNLETLRRCTNGSGFDPLAWQGGWSAVVRAPRVRTEEEWCRALLDQGVLVHPGHFYDFAEEAYLVLSLLPAPEVFREGVERITALSH